MGPLRPSGVPVVTGKRLEPQAMQEEERQADGDGRQQVARDDAGGKGEEGGDPVGVGCGARESAYPCPSPAFVSPRMYRATACSSASSPSSAKLTVIGRCCRTLSGRNSAMP